MNGLEERLRDEMARSVAGVRPAPDPLGRLLRRRRSRARRWGLSALGAVLVAAVLGAQPLAGTGDPSPQPAPTIALDEQPYLDEPLTDWTRRLLDAPARGAVAAGVVDGLTQELLAARNGWHVKPGLDRVKVLFVAEVAGHRTFGAVFHDGVRAQYVASAGPADATLTDLADGRYGAEYGGLSPLVLSGNARDYTIAVVPPGCVAEPSARTAVGADGTLEHTWGAGGEFVTLPAVAVWWRVTCGGTVREVTYRTVVPGRSPVTDAPPAERGQDLPDISAKLLRQWPDLPGLDVRQHRILWGGTPPGERRPVVVALGELGDGSVQVCAVAGTGNAMLVTDVHGQALQQPPKDFPEARMTTAVAASDAIVTVRLPDDATLGYSDRLLVIAPPDAARLRVNGQTVPLTDGVGVLTVPAPATLTIEALDAAGRTLATRAVAEPHADRFLAGQAVIRDWD
ncbi:hypothetical protein ACFFX1_08140 [Dactylosporangium sucinum]|uniref:Uncharacterized protein n=1 Tax=Dactylosporangium sucinum TaxID=1424081 RepID=A0A917U448_9ACTN|nr:hypothetical protein [Dactylosporangium sucinum]GGM55593.1 hypothetical protein GCM10007977_066590 [Dactylosporangium sucinum]